MSFKLQQLDGYKRYLLNRGTCDSAVTEYIENCLAIENEAVNHSFHKIMIHCWSASMEDALEAVSQHFSITFIPVNSSYSRNIVSFYTSSLYLVMNIIKFDFIFPFGYNMNNMDILFNDKSSLELFGIRLSIKEIVSNVVANRFNDKMELDLSNFCEDKDFKERNINFYKFSLLAQFKILMIRVGKDTRVLNLSNNKLSQPPLEILNFFIKGDLIAINLSNNNIQSISELTRVSSKIESLWLEGNPLCESIEDVSTYVKSIMLKFPRLTELDGVKIRHFGCFYPCHKNFLATPDRRTKMIAEKFLSLFFSHYDSPSRSDRMKMDMFYDTKATVTVNAHLSVAEAKVLPHLTQYSRNFLNPVQKAALSINSRVYALRTNIVNLFSNFRETVHDPNTFTVDVLMHDNKSMILVVDGFYKEVASSDNPERIFQFRRTFVFNVHVYGSNSMYHIANEIFSISLATKEQAQNCFMSPIRNLNSLALIEPDEEDVKTLTKVYSHLTNMKESDSLLRLKASNWDIKEALIKFMADLNGNLIPDEKFIEEEQFSDLSSLVDEID